VGHVGTFLTKTHFYKTLSILNIQLHCIFIPTYVANSLMIVIQQKYNANLKKRFFYDPSPNVPTFPAMGHVGTLYGVGWNILVKGRYSRLYIIFNIIKF